MLNERIPLKGRLQISLNGSVVRDIENLVVTTGTDWVAARMADGAGTTSVSKMGIGTDATAAVAGDQWIGATAPAVSMSASSSQVADLLTQTATGSEIQFSTTFLGTGAGQPNAAINEAGLLTSDDILIARTTFNTVNKDYNDEMTITWTITIASS
jgi:hypothetical protein